MGKQKSTEATKAATAKQQAVALSKQAAAAAALLPSNTAFGKQPEQIEHKGYLRIQDSPEHQQKAFIKFPVSSIQSQDVIVEATLLLETRRRPRSCHRQYGLLFLE